MKEKILVTGGLGFIGSHIVNALSKQTDRDILVYDVNAHDAKRRNIVTVQGDIFDSDKLLKVMRGGEISDVVHMVGLASIPSCKENSDASYKLNVASVQAVLEAMRLSGVKRLVFPSTAAIYGATNGPQVGEETKPRPSTVYGSHKLEAEQLIREYSGNYGCQYTILRLFNVYGDLDKEQGVVSLFLRKGLAGEPLTIKGGGQLRDFVFLSDVVEAFVNALNSVDSNHQTINVGSGVGVSINELAEMIRQSFPTVQIKYAPPNGDEYSIYADISRLKKILGCKPIPPDKGISAFVERCKLESAARVGKQWPSK